MRIIDLQIHGPSIRLAWNDESIEVQRKMRTELVLAYRELSGVESFVLFPQDFEWADDICSTYPDNFKYVIRSNAFREDPNLEELVDRSAENPNVVGWRITIENWGDDPEADAIKVKEGIYDRLLTRMDKVGGMPLFFMATGNLPVAAEVIEKYPGITFIIDHLGIPQPPLFLHDDPPFKHWPEFVTLSRFPNTALKMCGFPSLSDDPYPYRDVWPQLRELVDAYGADRIMWGSDISRFNSAGNLWTSRSAPGADTPGVGRRLSDKGEIAPNYEGKHNYFESLGFVRDADVLTEDEKEQILSRSAERILNWPLG